MHQLKTNVNVTQKLDSFCQELLVTCQFQVNLNALEVQIASTTVHNYV